MSAAEHPRLILAALLRGARERRNLTRNDVARRVGASIERIGDYEAGDVIPPSDVWRRYGASIDSSLHHRNREYQDAINSPRIEPATTATTATAAPPPAFNPPRVVTIAAPAVAESPARNVSHLRARQKEIAAAGYHFRRAEERDRRINEARRIVAERPGIALTELREILQSKFQGVALTHDVLRGLRDEAQAKVTRAIDRIATRTAREQSEQAPEVTSPQDSRHPCGCATGTHAWHGFCPFVAPELRADRGMTAGPTPPEPVDPPSIDATIGAAIDLILEAVPDLASLTLAVDAAGAAQVSYSRREVRVVETSGNLTRKKT